MAVCFVKGDWFDVPPGALAEARISKTQTAPLPRNWEAMDLDQKWAWSQANKSSEITACHIYYKGHYLGKLIDDEITKDIELSIAHPSSVAVICIAPFVYSGEYQADGCMVRVYTGGFAENFFRKWRRKQLFVEIWGIAKVLVLMAALSAISFFIFRA